MFKKYFLSNPPLFIVLVLGVVILLNVSASAFFAAHTYVARPQDVSGRVVLPTSTNSSSQAVRDINTYQVPTPTTDPDPIIACEINTNCGGGTMQLRRSECSNTTCCQIGNKWVLYKDPNQCTSDQNTYYKTGDAGGNYVLPHYSYPTYPPLQTSEQTPGYSYSSPTATPYQQQAPNLSQNSALQQQCISQADYSLNIAKNNCTTQLSSGSEYLQNCIQSAQQQHDQTVVLCEHDFPTN